MIDCVLYFGFNGHIKVQNASEFVNYRVSLRTPPRTAVDVAMAQMGFIDLSDRYASLHAKKDPLVDIDA